MHKNPLKIEYIYLSWLNQKNPFGHREKTRLNPTTGIRLSHSVSHSEKNNFLSQPVKNGHAEHQFSKAKDCSGRQQLSKAKAQFLSFKQNCVLWTTKSFSVFFSRFCQMFNYELVISTDKSLLLLENCCTTDTLKVKRREDWKV